MPPRSGVTRVDAAAAAEHVPVETSRREDAARGKFGVVLEWAAVDCGYYIKLYCDPERVQAEAQLRFGRHGAEVSGGSYAAPAGVAGAPHDQWAVHGLRDMPVRRTVGMGVRGRGRTVLHSVVGPRAAAFVFIWLRGGDPCEDEYGPNWMYTYESFGSDTMVCEHGGSGLRAPYPD